MTKSQDESTLSQVVEEKMSLNDHDPQPKDDDEDVVLTTAGSLSSPIVCTAGSCSLPLQGALQPAKQTQKSDEQKQSDANNNNNTHHKNKIHRKKKKGGSSSSSSIQQIHTQSDLNKVLEQNDTVLLEFVTTWCTACHGIQPLYEELAQTAITTGDDATIKATQVVCDKNKETKKLADANGVGSYPVFILFENGREVNKWKGADVGKLEKAFDNHGGGGGFGGKKGKGGKGKKGKGRR